MVPRITEGMLVLAFVAILVATLGAAAGLEVHAMLTHVVHAFESA